MFKQFGCVYKITNLINGKCYIGQTVRPLDVRWKLHKRSSACRMIHRAIKKYGDQNFSIEEIYISFDLEDLNTKEQFFIEYYDSFNTGYNLNRGGKNYIRTEETKKKLSEWQLGEKSHRYGKPAWNKGKKLGFIPSKAFKPGNIPHTKGKKLSKDTIEKAVKSREWYYKNPKPVSDETRQKLKEINSKRIKCHELNLIFNSATEAAEFIGSTQGNVSSVARGLRKHAKGYRFSYV